MKPRRGKVDPAKVKARKQKKILIGACVFLFALAAFELPKLMKHGKPASAAPPAATTTTDTTAAPPAAGTPEPVSVPAVPATLPDQRGASASEGQLVSFSLLKSKDPFVQQLNEAGQPGDKSSTTTTTTTTPGPTSSTPSTPAEPNPPSSTPPASTPPASTPPASIPPVAAPPVATPPASTTPASTPPASTPPASTPPASTTPASTPPSSAKPPSAPTAATISVNGTAETVSVGASFPKAQPLFRLVSIKDGAVRIGVAGGTLQGKTQTVLLVTGKSLTLMNTADGMRYVLKLVSLS